MSETEDRPWIRCEHSQGQCRYGWHASCTNRLEKSCRYGHTFSSWCTPRCREPEQSLCDKYRVPHEPDATGWCPVCETQARPQGLVEAAGFACHSPCAAPCIHCRTGQEVDSS